MGRSPHNFFLGWALLFFLSTGLFAQPIAQNGFIDLSDIDFQAQGSVELNGEWEFYWEELLEPHEIDSTRSPQFVSFPHLWNEDPRLSSYGYATYILRIHKPKNGPPLALTIPDMYTAYTLYINGVEAAKNGTVADNRQDYTPFWLPKTISIDHFNGDTLELVLHISNFRHSKGGIRLPLLIGNDEYLEKQRTIRLGFSLLLTGCVLMIGLFFLGLYLFGRHEIPMLYFSLVCFFFSYRVFGTELYPLHYLFQDLPWLLTVKAEYFALYFTPALFCIFVQRLYPKETSNGIIYPLAGVFGIMASSAIFLTPYYFTLIVDLFFALFSVFVIYITWVYIKAVKKKREGARFALASIILVFIVFMHNLLEYNTVLDENLLLNFIGLFSFFFLQSLILSYRFTNSLTKSRIKAEEAAKAKSQFLSTMSHEIRTPLNAVIGLSELLLHSDSEKEHREFAQNIKQSGEHLLEILNNILDYSKFESMGIDTEMEPVNIRKLVREIIHLLSPLSSNKDLKIELKIEEDVSEWVLSDATHLKQILINLVGNAIKFTSKGSISVLLQTNDVVNRKGDLKFTIADTGTGISNKNIHRLFKSFSQADPSSTRKYGGTGLGLVISKKLVEALAGEIWFESEPGRGTTFYFTLKAPKTSNVQSIEQENDLNFEVSETKIADLNILVAEDNLMNQKVILKILQNINITASVVNNGQQVLDELYRHSYDLILMDMEMPVMDGIECTKRIRNSLPKDKQPVIIAITANAFLEDREKCLQAGMNDFLTKPVAIADVKDMFTKWFY